jgi:ParB family chromosome partitioning protein
MPRNLTTVGNLALAGYEDIFNLSTGNPNGEGVVQIPLTDLYPPEFHPFQINDDEAMYRLAMSVKQYGIREPGLARPRADGGYELVCGIRRKRACEIAEMTAMPVIIRELDDNLAAIIMIDSNLEHREKILPSEKAWAYKVMIDSLNHSGIKGENHSYEIMVERTGVKKSRLFRIIRLTELIVTLLDKVDANQLAFNPAVELSYLSVTEQTAVADAIATHGIKPSLSQSVRLKKLKQDDKLTIEMIYDILSEEKKPKDEPTGSARYRCFFPVCYSPAQIDEVIVELLTEWKSRTDTMKVL